MHLLIGITLLNEVNPEMYIRDLLERIPNMRISRVDDLLPWNVREAIAAKTTAHWLKSSPKWWRLNTYDKSEFSRIVISLPRN